MLTLNLAQTGQDRGGGASQFYHSLCATLLETLEDQTVTKRQHSCSGDYLLQCCLAEQPSTGFLAKQSTAPAKLYMQAMASRMACLHPLQQILHAAQDHPFIRVQPRSAGGPPTTPAGAAQPPPPQSCGWPAAAPGQPGAAAGPPQRTARKPHAPAQPPCTPHQILASQHYACNRGQAAACQRSTW